MPAPPKQRRFIGRSQRGLYNDTTIVVMSKHRRCRENRAGKLVSGRSDIKGCCGILDREHSHRSWPAAELQGARTTTNCARTHTQEEEHRTRNLTKIERGRNLRSPSHHLPGLLPPCPPPPPPPENRHGRSVCRSVRCSTEAWLEHMHMKDFTARMKISHIQRLASRLKRVIFY